MNNCQECKKLTSGLCKECFIKQNNPMQNIKTIKEKGICQNPQCGRKLHINNKDNFCHNEHCEYKVPSECQRALLDKVLSDIQREVEKMKKKH